MVKICGLTRMEDLTFAAKVGADALGIVFEPTSPRACDWSPEQVSNARTHVGPFGPPIVAVYGVAGPARSADLIQYVRGEAPQSPSILALRPEPDLDWGLLEERVAAARPCALVTDAWSPCQFGGTGERVSDAFVEEVLRRFSLPLILAGGLNPANVAVAVCRWRPYGVDVSSGVESSMGVKDPEKVRAFIEAAKSA
jgi:phosphoribosylanthranilate isomerase